MYDLNRGNDDLLQRHRLMRKAETKGASSAPAGNDLSLSLPEDKSEQEADTIAKTVAGGGTASVPPGDNSTSGNVQRKGEAGIDTIPEGFSSQLNSSKGNGHPLDETTKAEMESKMGADLSGVKIHTGNAADAMNSQIHSKAFAHGQDVFFGNGNYNPNSASGKELLAHELVHTQQGAGNMIQRGGFEDKLDEMKKSHEKRKKKKETEDDINLRLEIEENKIDEKDPKREKLNRLQKLRTKAEKKLKKTEDKEAKVLAKMTRQKGRKKDASKLKKAEDHNLAELIELYKEQEKYIVEFNQSNEEIRNIKGGLLTATDQKTVEDQDLSLSGVKEDKFIPWFFYPDPQVRHVMRAEKEIEFAESQSGVDPGLYADMRDKFESDIRTKHIQSGIQEGFVQNLPAIAGSMNDPFAMIRQLGSIMAKAFEKYGDKKEGARELMRLYLAGANQKNLEAGDAAMLVQIMLEEPAKISDKELIVQFLQKFDPDRKMANEIFGYEDPAKVKPHEYTEIMKDLGLTEKNFVKENKSTMSSKRFSKENSYNTKLIQQLEIAQEQNEHNMILATDKLEGYRRNEKPETVEVPVYKNKKEELLSNTYGEMKKNNQEGSDEFSPFVQTDDEKEEEPKNYNPISVLPGTLPYEAWEVQKKIEEAGTDLEKLTLAYDYYQVNYSNPADYFKNPATSLADFQSTVLGGDIKNINVVFANIPNQYKEQNPITGIYDIKGPLSGLKDLAIDYGLSFYKGNNKAPGKFSYFSNYTVKPALKNPWVASSLGVAGLAGTGLLVYNGIKTGDWSPMQMLSLVQIKKEFEVYKMSTQVGTDLYSDQLKLGITTKPDTNLHGSEELVNEFYKDPAFASKNLKPEEWYKKAPYSTPGLNFGASLDFLKTKSKVPFSAFKDQYAPKTENLFNLKLAYNANLQLGQGNNANPPTTLDKFAWQTANLPKLGFLNPSAMQNSLQNRPTESVFNQSFFLTTQGRLKNFNYKVESGIQSFALNDKSANLNVGVINAGIGFSDLKLPGLDGKFSIGATSTNAFGSNDEHINMLSGMMKYDGSIIHFEGKYTKNLNGPESEFGIKLGADLPIKSGEFKAMLLFEAGSVPATDLLKGTNQFKLNLVIHL